MTSQHVIRFVVILSTIVSGEVERAVAQVSRQDIVFVLDLSGSVSDHRVMQRNALASFIEDPTILARDGTVHIAALAFAPAPWNPSNPQQEVPLTVLTSQAVAEAFADSILNLNTTSSNPNLALDRANAILSYTGRDNSRQFILFSSDGGFGSQNYSDTLARCEAFRDDEVTVCSAGLRPWGCEIAPVGFAHEFQQWANSVESGPYDHPPIGEWACVTPGSQQQNELAFQGLCTDCLCPVVHSGESDCDSDEIPDLCETDCDDDGMPDDCESHSDSDGIPDDCDNCPTVANPDQSDCDEDGIGDPCDGGDMDNDVIPDTQDNCPCVPNSNQRRAPRPSPFRRAVERFRSISC